MSLEIADFHSVYKPDDLSVILRNDFRDRFLGLALQVERFRQVIEVMLKA
jgi:hypothetical protein